MELNFGADFDEDLFDVKPQRKSNDRSEAIKNYRPKQVQSRVFKPNNKFCSLRNPQKNKNF